jgi:hypothetical protein
LVRFKRYRGLRQFVYAAIPFGTPVFLVERTQAIPFLPFMPSTPL